MGLQLRTGKNGKNVTSDSDGRLYAGIAGTDRYVLDDGNKLAASLSDSNTLVVQSGAMLINGRHVTLDGTQTWNIPNGAQDKKRSNLCVVRYTKDSNGTETAEAVTLSGDLTDGDPVDPAYNNTSILQNGTTISDYPLYRVITDGISTNDPVKLFNVLNPLASVGASLYPVGSIYLSTVATNPKTLLGFGTWEQIKDRFLLAAGTTYTAGSTGGEATHKLTVNEMPEHDHSINLNYADNSGGSSGHTSAWGNHRGSKFGISSTGGNTAHNNMPPYLTVYIWKRTA